MGGNEHFKKIKDSFKFLEISRKLRGVFNKYLFLKLFSPSDFLETKYTIVTAGVMFI